jgi:hypothetical protein
MDSSSSQQQQQQLLLLSAATTPAGSAYSSPSASSSTLSNNSSGSIIKALAPKKLLEKREPPHAHTVIKSRTIIPSTEPKPKMVDFPVMVLAPENPIPIKCSTPQEEDAEVANDLPTIPYRKKDKYGNPFYLTWMPHALDGYLGDDHVIVLVHFKQCCLETEETKPKLVDYKKHILDGRLKEMPLSARGS